MRTKPSTTAELVMHIVILIVGAALVYGWYWLMVFCLSALLGWLGVSGFPKPIEWWIPLVLFFITWFIGNLFKKEDKK